MDLPRGIEPLLPDYESGALPTELWYVSTLCQATLIATDALTLSAAVGDVRVVRGFHRVRAPLQASLPFQGSVCIPSWLGHI